MNPPLPPAARNRRRIPLAAWLGGVLLLSSVLLAAHGLRTHANDSGSRGPAPAPARLDRVVAIGHVDVERGVTPVYPVQPGRVVKVEAHEGKPVEADAPLLVLDETLARLQVDEAKAALEGARVQQTQARALAAQHREQVLAQRQAVEGARVTVDLARVQRDKAKRRLENGSGVVQKEDVESAELMVKKAEAGLEGEKARLAALEALNPDLAVDLAGKDVEGKQVLVRKAEQGLKECTVRAPFAGTPLRVQVSVGETLGTSPRQPAVLFCPNDPRIVRAEVEQEFAGRVALGQKADVEDDATGGRQWAGTVERISDWYSQRRSVLLEPLQFNDVRTLECIISLDPGSIDPKNPPRIGQRVRVILR